MAQTGSDGSSAKAGTISRDTLYAWINRYPEFAEQVSQAKAEYRETCPEVLVRQANKAFSDYLYGRMEKVVRITKKGTTSRGDGEIGYEEEVIQRVPVGVPRWAIERVLGKPMDVLEAAKTFAEAGILPHWIVQRIAEEIEGAKKGIRNAFEGVLPDADFRAEKPGLSPQTAAAIRAHVLGIDLAQQNNLDDSKPLTEEVSR